MVHDGESSNGINSLLLRLTGDENLNPQILQTPITSTTNQMLITFTSDKTESRLGFKLLFEKGNVIKSDAGLETVHY